MAAAGATGAQTAPNEKRRASAPPGLSITVEADYGEVTTNE